MLGTLRKIVQEVNAAKDLKAALGIIVLRVREAMGSQVCSVYLLDPETERFVLMATEGLNKRAIGKVSMAPNEGLVGLVGTREEPLKIFHKALESAQPMVEVKSRRVGGANYQVPVEVSSQRKMALSMRWIIQYARQRSGRSMREKLANELIEAAHQRGSAVKKRDDVHRMAEANKAFSHYRW